MKKRVADIVVELLVKNGITDCFSVVGGGAMHLNNAFRINNDMSVWYCHHEQACSFAAEGYAKLSGMVAAVCVTSGPGGVNALNGVYSAYVDSTPMVVIAGHPRSDTTVESTGLNLRCRGVQEFDIVSSVKKMTKYSVMINNPKDVCHEVQKAINIAKSGRKGPVWVSIPLDYQSATIEYDEDAEYIDQSENRDLSEDVNDLYNEIKKAERPVILTGSGVRYSGAAGEFYEFIKKVDIPVVGGDFLTDLLPDGYPNYYGLSSGIGPRTGNTIIEYADLVVVIGNSLSARQIGFNSEAFAPNARIIMIDVDENEMKKPELRIDRRIVADAKDFLSTYNKIAGDVKCSDEWKSFCNDIYSFYKDFDTPEVREYIPSKLFWKSFLELINEDDIIALGNSNCTVGMYQYGIKKMGQRVITNLNAGSMGCDLPEAFGCAVASGRRVICVTGDGSIMMNLQELQTISYNRKDIKIVVFSNNGYGAIRQTCRNYFEGLYTGCDPESGISIPNFRDVATAFKMNYYHLEKTEDIEATLKVFLESEGQTILEVEQDREDTVMPRIQSKLRNDGTFEKPKYVDFSPRLTEEQEETLQKIKEEHSIK